MNGLPTEILVVLIGAGVVVLAWLLLRFGKLIARWALIFGVLAAVIIFGLALLESNRAAHQAATAATVSSVGAGAATGLAWLLGILLAVAVGVIGWLLYRQKRRTENAQGRLAGDRLRWDRLPRQRRRQEPQIYFVEDFDNVEQEEFWSW